MSNLDTFDLRRLQAGLNNRTTGQQVFDLLSDPGSIAVAAINIATNPTATDTIGIGADTYEFVAAAGDVADDANIAVEIKGSATLTRDELVAAINATDANNQHPTIFQTDSTTPALANGTEAVLATEVGTTVLIQSATKPGGAIQAADPSIVLAEALTDASDVWDVGDVNVNTLAGRAKSQRQQATTSIAITAAMITAGVIRIDLPWQPTHWTWQARQATGEIRQSVADIVIASAAGLAVTLDGGISPSIQATDVLTVVAYE